MHVRGVGRKHKGNDRAAQLFVDAHPGFGIEVGAAELFGRVKGPETELPALFQKRRLFFRGQPEVFTPGLAREDCGFQGHEFLVDEFRHQVLDHPGFVHGDVRLVLCCHCFLLIGHAGSGTLLVVSANNADHTVRRHHRARWRLHQTPAPNSCTA